MHSIEFFVQDVFWRPMEIDFPLKNPSQEILLIKLLEEK